MAPKGASRDAPSSNHRAHNMKLHPLFMIFLLCTVSASPAGFLERDIAPAALDPNSQPIPALTPPLDASQPGPEPEPVAPAQGSVKLFQNPFDKLINWFDSVCNKIQRAKEEHEQRKQQMQSAGNVFQKILNFFHHQEPSNTPSPPPPPSPNLAPNVAPAQNVPEYQPYTTEAAAQPTQQPAQVAPDVAPMTTQAEPAYTPQADSGTQNYAPVDNNNYNMAYGSGNANYANGGGYSSNNGMYSDNSGGADYGSNYNNYYSGNGDGGSYSNGNYDNGNYNHAGDSTYSDSSAHEGKAADDYSNDGGKDKPLSSGYWASTGSGSVRPTMTSVRFPMTTAVNWTSTSFNYSMITRATSPLSVPSMFRMTASPLSSVPVNGVPENELSKALFVLLGLITWFLS
ncbi:uncharacterized protein VTP21DRAFT_3408 [Calcarisporiella thermophila]|uniref:uncharacterized protein n=1 Tax=Calcarisporiella thermophila TaxID=911321 RepID=UPI0037424808